MEIVLAALVAAAVAVAVVLLVHRPRTVQAAAGTVATPERTAAGDIRPAGATREALEEELGSLPRSWSNRRCSTRPPVGCSDFAPGSWTSASARSPTGSGTWTTAARS